MALGPKRSHRGLLDKITFWKDTMSTPTIKNVDNCTWVELVISHARITPYLLACQHSLPRAIELYTTNIEDSTYLFKWLAVLEVALRNALIASLTPKNHSGEFDPFVFVWASLADEAKAAVKNAENRLGQTGRKLRTGAVIAELQFGFWKHLLSNRYEAILWTPNLRFAFPALWPQRRGTVFEAVERAGALRNRIAHHEPIFSNHLVGELLNIQQVLGWISPAALEWAIANLE